MALLAEELVEEWLRRQGFFTIRGARLGIQEIDILAVRHGDAGVTCRHVEVQCSIDPMSYMLPLPRSVRQLTGRAAHNAKARSAEEIEQGAREWLSKKFTDPKKDRLRKSLWPGESWAFHLVVNRLRHEEELEALQKVLPELQVHRLRDVIDEFGNKSLVVQKAAGHDLVELVWLRAPTG